MTPPVKYDRLEVDELIDDALAHVQVAYSRACTVSRLLRPAAPGADDPLAALAQESADDILLGHMGLAALRGLLKGTVT